jgi:hypothetical protein
MVLDYQPQRMDNRRTGRPFGHFVRQLAANLRMISMPSGCRRRATTTPGKEQKAVPNPAIGSVFAVWGLFGFPDTVNCSGRRRVFVGGVLLIKLMLHQASHASNSGIYFPGVHFMHGAQNPATFPR